MWRHFVFVVAIVLLIVAGLIVVAIVGLMVYAAGYGLRLRFREYRIRRRFVARGRFSPWSKVVEKLIQGQGTLIVQFVTWEGPYVGGAIREWWTRDDVIGRAPVPLPPALDRLPTDDALKQLLEYSGKVVSECTDVDSGLASLTVRPTHWIRKWSRIYPKDKIVTLLIWEGKWLVLSGDSDTALSWLP
jgi:hypothetical protein